MTKTKKTGPLTPEDYEKFGKTLEGVLIKDYLDMLGNPRRQLRMSFLRGIAAGLGSVIGATVVVALIVWILHMLGGIPVIGDFLNHTSQQIQQ